MASIKNRSSWVVQLRGRDSRSFRTEAKALEHVRSLGLDPNSLPRSAITRGKGSFEVQISLTDKNGQKLKRSETFSTEKEAKDWAAQTTKDLKRVIASHGNFSVEYETITVEQALQKLLVEHYAKKASYNEVRLRMPRLAEWLGANRRFRDLTRADMVKLLNTLEAHPYSASSIRNFVTILTTLYKKAKAKWNFPVENIASGLDLPKPNNAIERYWRGDEKARLMASIGERSPWLVPIVELSLEMAFRRSELVQAPVRAAPEMTSMPQQKQSLNSQTASPTGRNSGGLHWEHIDWAANCIRLPKEKNDHAKKVTESKGRIVPITSKMKDILMPMYAESSTKSGPVFQKTINSVSKAFKEACDAASPPIENLTFHSLRKIATKDLSTLVPNPKALGKLSGHKNMQVLFDRYFDVTFEQLNAMLNQSSDSIRDRGMTILLGALGTEKTRTFIREVRSLKDINEAFGSTPAPSPGG